MMQDVPELKFLSRLSEARRPAFSADQDIRGYRVMDVAAKEVGRVNDLLLDATSQRVRFVEIRTPSQGRRTLLIPFNQVTVIGRDRVILPAALDQLDQGRG